MKKKYIWLLTGIMTFTMIWLIIVQARWIENATIVKEQQFRRTVNKALYEAVQKFEESEVVLEITKETYSVATDTTKLPGYKNAGFNEKSVVLEIKKVKKDTGVTDYSLSEKKISDDIRKELIKNKKVYIEKLFNKLVRKELKLEDRLDTSKIAKTLNMVFAQNEITVPYEFAIRNQNNNYTTKSKNFNLSYVKQTYEILLFPNDFYSAQNYLVVYFTKDKSYANKDMPQTILTSILLTIIISITFFFTVYIIFRQRRLSEIKNDFINNMTHELKTPVSTISLASQMLKDKSLQLDSEKIGRISNIIDDESKRLSFQIDKVLQTSIFEKGGTHFKFKEIEVHELITVAVLNMNLKVKSKGGSIITDLQATNSRINADEMHITNVIFNLLDNAVKYSKEDVPAEIKISTKNIKEFLQVEISDNGIGVSKENQKKIFNKFYRVQKGNLHDVKGFGLGLNYVKRVIEEHKGTITVTSELGKGTTFIIQLATISVEKV